MKKSFLSIIGFILLLLSFFISCKEEPPIFPPPPTGINDTITISIEQITHRSIVVDVNTTTNNPNSTLLLYRRINNNDTLVSEYPITITDTSIVDDNNGTGLQLDTEYYYYALRKTETDELKDTSNFVVAKTLAVTNFNYTWREFALGEPGSLLFDVWGAGENNVYAVGRVELNDTVYGIIRWDGNSWLPEKRIGGLQAIYGFSISDIWAVGGGVWHFNGSEWEEYTYRDSVITESITYYSVWGTSSSDLFMGSGGGKIIHWNGNNAQIVYTNPDQVFVNNLDGIASDFIIGVGTGMVPPLLAVKYDGTSWTDLPISSNWALNSVSIVTKNHIYFAGGGIFEMKGADFSRIFNSGYYVWDIEYYRQAGVTVASGAYDGIYINNGLEWRNYQGQISTDETTYSGIFSTNNTIFCVGRNDTQAKILIGKN